MPLRARFHPCGRPAAVPGILPCGRPAAVPGILPCGRPAAVLALLLAACVANDETAGRAAPLPLADPALKNGDFAKGTSGWDLTGAAPSFRVFKDPVVGERYTLTTFVENENGERATGTVSQAFTVPDDAVALRFVLHGGQAHVRLYEGDKILEDAIGMNDNATRIPVSWEMFAYRGLRLRLAIEDTEAGDWGFVSVSGFDLMRDVPAPIENMDFSDGIAGWEATGDAAFFSVFRDGLAGGRWTVTTAARSGPHLMDKATGTLSQVFKVPDDAVALRFFVHGGRKAYVRLWDRQVLLASVTGVDSNSVRVPVSWDLVPHRGNVVRLSIEDPSVESGWGFIGSSGFDVVTLRNGP